MADINLLTNEISDLIAAGEVIERPSSVVKELIENSIDAGATQIKIEIMGGGLKSIKVSDDACGMSASNAEKCFLKHATSKILNKEDLFSIKTLGFRGEALPSIAAVSKVRLITKEKDSLLGCEIINEGGTIKSKKEIGSADGTSFEVSDLFYNTPARLKFMKSEQAEIGVINSLIEKLALSHPNISFKFVSNGNVRLFTPGNGKISDAVYSIYGKDFTSRLLKVDYKESSIKISGFTGKPLLNKPNRNFQVFFVNGRLIRSRVLQQSLENCYRNAMLVGRYPCCIIFLEIPFEEVDINVHPSKTEIKFSDDSFISNHITKAVSLALKNDVGVFRVEEKQSTQEKLEAKTKVSIEKTPTEAIVAETKKEISSIKNDNIFESVESFPKNREAEKEIKNQKVEITDTFGNWKISTEKPQIIKVTKSQQIKPISLDDHPFSSSLELASNTAKLNSIPLYVEHKEIKKEDSNSKINNFEVKEEKPAQEYLFKDDSVKESKDNLKQQQIDNKIQTEIIPGKEESFRIIGEAFKTYVIIEKEDELQLIDKHALHERIIFERLKNNTGVSSQILLTPYVCNLGTSENSIIIAHKEEFEKLGFDVSDLGNALIVREIPDIVNATDIEFILAKAVESLKTNKEITEEIFDELLYIVACKAAIKSGYNTTLAELESLIKEYFQNRDNLRYCPHGRPITISFTEKFIEKQFKRSV